MPVPPRNARQRKQDALHRLEHDVDVWVATADKGDSSPYLVPLSFLWDGGTVLLSTPRASRTGQNLHVMGKARLGIGQTRDLVIIEGTVAQIVAATEISGELAESFAAKTGFDPRQQSNAYDYFRIQPQRIQAWREADELEGRVIMREGQWVVPD